MIKMEDRIPKLAERTVIEEYYKFYQVVNAEKSLIHKKRTFTTNPEKLTEKDTSDKSLMDAIGTIRNDAEKFKFLLVYDDEKNLSAVARLIFNADNIHMGEIIYVNYPDILEKLTSLNEVINYLSKLGLEYDVKDVSMELLNGDGALIKFAEGSGFSNNSHDEFKYQTTILTKNVRKKDLNGPTLSRKQA